ncbi:protein Star-like isoform X2 [Oratosquilla oratoria]|uniref:protein Star-like isoform X2 n=1 Tax=Oratosquilla oratoria TaxID=337810 RepID=UPI003F75CA91
MKESRMIRIRGLLYLVGSLLLFFLLLLFTTDSISLSAFLKPVPHSPRLLKLDVQTKLNNENISADDPEVLRVLRQLYLVSPSKEAYNLSFPDDPNPSMGQAQRIDFILKRKVNGFFIECGALDGEVRSNTLFFERDRGWKGILIEADPSNYEKLLFKHRKAFLSPACLAPTSYPTAVSFQQQANQGHIIGSVDNPSGNVELGDIVKVQCFPLYSYLMALNTSTVDYFSLDVEGAELSVLKTIPWDKVDIKVGPVPCQLCCLTKLLHQTLSVEFIHDHEGKEAIREYMTSKGYYVHSEVTHVNWLANDFIFVKNGL